MTQQTKKNYDSQFCGNLPLHLINSIQPYGFVLVVNPKNSLIVQVSENLQEFLGLAPSAILNKSLSDFFHSDNNETLKAFVAAAQGHSMTSVIHFNDSANHATFNCTGHDLTQYVVLELEPITQSPKEETSNYQHIKQMMEMLKTADSTMNACSLIAAHIKQLSGFDKVMVYRFDEEWNGSVLAEEKEEGMAAYLDLRFPASDIPKQAREMYKKNSYRLIPDRSYTPVRLTPMLNPVTYTYTDLSTCNMRGVAPVHIEYLANMEVTASMSIPVIVKDVLWGLIACHHRVAKNLPSEIRAVLDVVANLLSSHIQYKQHEESLMYQNHIDKIQGVLFRKMMLHPDLATALLMPPHNICDLFEGTGAVISEDHGIRTQGQVPVKEVIDEILFWLKCNPVSDVYHTDSIASIIPLSEELMLSLGGFIAIPTGEHHGNFILVFRPEVVETIHWGGNPNEAIQFEENNKTYHPRHSFDIWKETSRYKCKPWSEALVGAARELMETIFKAQQKID